MKRVRSQTKATLVAVLAGIAVASAITASSAIAAPTLPPLITDMPSNPSTVAAPTFEVEKDPAEPNQVTQLQCRSYVGSPPGVNSGWKYCSTVEDPFNGAWTARDLANGNAGFQTRARDNQTNTSGPLATYNWVLNAAAPTLAPVMTEKPDNPNTTEFRNTFVFEPGVGDENNVNGYQCRVDSVVAAWANCNTNQTEFGQPAGLLEIVPGNGTHSLEVRAKSGGGESPVTTYQWNNDVPNDSNPSVFFNDVKVTTWAGKANDYLGESDVWVSDALQNAGDVNGDGRDDLLAGSSYVTTTMEEVLVLYSTANGLGNRTTTAFGPNLGYSMKLPPGMTAGGFNAIGDQNGDDVPDFLIKYGLASTTLAIVYGVADATELPRCELDAQKRCLDVASLSSDQGYYLTSTSFPSLVYTSSTGDFDGDGQDDFQVVTGAPGAVQSRVIKGVDRTGTVSIDALPASETFTILGGSQMFIGMFADEVGDFNQDGKDDFYFSAFFNGTGYIFYGREFPAASIDLDTFSENDGVKLIDSPLFLNRATAAGDVNGDGRPDLGVSSISGSDIGLGVTMLYGPEQPTADPMLVGEDLLPDTGYLLDDQGTASDFGVQAAPAGDFNNDGIPDMLFTSSLAQGNGFQNAGGGYVTFGQRPTPAEVLGVASDLTAETGVAFRGDVSGGARGIGTAIASLGDIDGDGIGDFAIGWGGAGSAGTNDGEVIIVSGGKVMASAKAGGVTDIMKSSATLNASVTTTGRDSEVVFEHGTTNEYGETSAPIEVEGSGSGTAVSLELSGLAANTEYHYRTVTTNSLGLTYYGDDQTFSTNDDGGPVVDPCLTNPAAPGCPGYDHCKTVPADCGRGSGPKLTLIASPKTLKVKRGKKGRVSAIVVNTGGKAAKGVKVCVKAPKKSVKVKRCQTVGGLGSGKTKTKAFKVTVKKSAKKGKKIALKFTASGKGIGAKKATAKVAVR